MIDLLVPFGLDRNARCKFMRHRDPRYNLAVVHRLGLLDVYQAFQVRPEFHSVDYVASFAGLDGKQAMFLGMYRVLGERPSTEVKLPTGSPFYEWTTRDEYFYELARMPEFDELANRAVIDWGEGAKASRQWMCDKEVIEVLPKNSVTWPFLFRNASLAARKGDDVVIG
jgi:hypothetical protein